MPLAFLPQPESFYTRDRHFCDPDTDQDTGDRKSVHKGSSQVDKASGSTGCNQNPPHSPDLGEHGKWTPLLVWAFLPSLTL